MLFISTQPLLPIPSSWPKYKCHQFITSNLCGLSFIITIWEEGELPIFELRIDENMSILRSSYSNLDVKKVEHSHCHLLWVCLSIIIYFYILKTSELTTIIYQKVRNFEKGVKKKKDSIPNWWFCGLPGDSMIAGICHPTDVIHIEFVLLCFSLNFFDKFIKLDVFFKNSTPHLGGWS